MPSQTSKLVLSVALFCLAIPAALPGALSGERALDEASRALEAQDYQAAAAKLFELGESLKNKLKPAPEPQRQYAAMLAGTAPNQTPARFIDAARQALRVVDKDGAWFNTFSAVASTAAIIHAQPARPRHLASAAAALQQDSPVRMHAAARLALETGDFADALDYCLKEVEMWRRHPMGQPLNAIHSHRAQSLLGQVHLAQGNIPLALQALAESVKQISAIPDWGAQSPGMALAKKLIEANHQTEVAACLALCEQIEWNGKDKIAQRRADLAAGRLPRFDPISLAF